MSKCLAVFSAIFMGLACLITPVVWSADQQEADYRLGRPATARDIEALEHRCLAGWAGIATGTGYGQTGRAVYGTKRAGCTGKQGKKDRMICWSAATEACEARSLSNHRQLLALRDDVI